MFHPNKLSNLNKIHCFFIFNELVFFKNKGIIMSRWLKPIRMKMFLKRVHNRSSECKLRARRKTIRLKFIDLNQFFFLNSVNFVIHLGNTRCRSVRNFLKGAIYEKIQISYYADCFFIFINCIRVQYC